MHVVAFNDIIVWYLWSYRVFFFSDLDFVWIEYFVSDNIEKEKVKFGKQRDKKWGNFNQKRTSLPGNETKLCLRCLKLNLLANLFLKLPYIAPILMLLITIGLVAVSLFSPNFGHLIAIGITMSGLFYYFPFVYFKLSFKLVG